MEEKAQKARELQEKMAALLMRANAQSAEIIVRSENIHVITPPSPSQRTDPPPLQDSKIE